MSKYDFEELVKMWALEQLTAEQAIGQMLLQLRELLERVNRLERALRLRPSDATPGPQSSN
ncbi:MAG: hypothetical protein U0350_01030 [Caldilineaceae bacterium]